VGWFVFTINKHRLTFDAAGVFVREADLPDVRSFGGNLDKGNTVFFLSQDTVLFHTTGLSNAPSSYRIESLKTV
jgi:hypothetical protein